MIRDSRGCFGGWDCDHLFLFIGLVWVSLILIGTFEVWSVGLGTIAHLL